jgi:HlyD family secretion protein
VTADQVTNFDVKIMMLKDSYEDLIKPNSPIPSPFRPGMSATVEIETETEYGILTIPIQAVTTRADTSGRVKTAREKREEKNVGENGKKDSEEDIMEYVFKFENDKAILTAVTTGIQDNTYIQITEGVEDGDEIIVAPYRAVSKSLKNRDAVEKVKKEELFKDED